MVLEQRPQDVVEGGDALAQLLIGQRGHVGPVGADAHHVLTVGVVLGQSGGTDDLLDQPAAGALRELRVLVEVPLLALVAGNAGHVAEVLQVDGFRRHPRHADAEQPHQRHVDVQVAAEGREDVVVDRGVVEVVIPDLACDEGVPQPGSRLCWKPAEAFNGLIGSGKISPTFAREYRGNTFDTVSLMGHSAMRCLLSDKCFGVPVSFRNDARRLSC